MSAEPSKPHVDGGGQSVDRPPDIVLEIRELVEPRYGYIIPYIVTDGSILILRVYRAVRSPLDYDDEDGEAT